MYEKYWNLKDKPFQNTPNPDYLYLSAQHEAALMKLTYVIAQNLGCGMLTGVFGCGKTLLSRVLVKNMGEEKFRVAFVTNPMVSEPSELVRSIVRSLSPQELPEKKTELLADSLLEKLQNILIENLRDGKENLVVIDEAHTIDDNRVFEQLRLILNFQQEDRFLLTLMLVGQPELESKVDALKPLAQRVPIRCTLDPLSKEEVANYIVSRISKAVDSAAPEDALVPVFGGEAVKTIFEYSGGIPRRINTLCDLVLMSGFAKQQQDLTAEFIKSVIKEFNLN